MGRILIDGEPRRISRNLVEQPVMGPEVDALEVAAIPDWRNLDPLPKQELTPAGELLLIGRPEGDVVGLPGPFAGATGTGRPAEQGHVAGWKDTGAVVVGPEVVESVGVVLVDASLDQSQAQGLVVKIIGGLQIVGEAGDVVNALQAHCLVNHLDRLRVGKRLDCRLVTVTD